MKFPIRNASTDTSFFHVPADFSREYLQKTLSTHYDRNVSINNVEGVNLCADNGYGVSNSGATVLKLTMAIDDAPDVVAVAKILSPDTMNLFKSDYQFDSRLSEVAWSEWWTKQTVPFAPVVFGTRSDIERRNFWILSEYFDNVAQSGSKQFAENTDGRQILLEYMAKFHAHSRKHISELMSLFSDKSPRSGFYCSPDDIARQLLAYADDEPFLSSIEFTDEERRLLYSHCESVHKRPKWVDGWHTACITVDWAPDNLGTRHGPGGEVLVNADWGTTRLGAIEEDLVVSLGRLSVSDPMLKRELIEYYIACYAARTECDFGPDDIEARLPWARLLSTMRYLTEHLKILSWVPIQPQAKKFAHMFTRLCEDQLKECQLS